MFRLLAPLLSLILLAAPLIAETRQYGAVVYTSDPHWTLGRTRDGIQVFLLELPGDRCEFCTLEVTLPLPKTGSITNAALAHAAHFVDEDDLDELTPLGEARALTLDGRPAALASVKTDDELYIVIAVDLGPQMVLIGFEASIRTPERVQEAQAGFLDHALPFIQGFTFAAPGETLLPQARPGRLSGVYWGTDIRTRLGFDGFLQTVVHHETLVFFPDGHFYHGTPPQGTAPLDRAARIAAHDQDFGVYEETRDGITLTYASGETRTLSRGDNGALALGRTTLRPRAVPADGTRIEGSITDFSFSGFAPGTGLDGGIAHASDMTFTADGRFTAGRFTSASASSSSGGITTSTERDSSGTYVIKDGLIIMTHRDGSQTAEMIIETTGGYLIGELFLE